MAIRKVAAVQSNVSGRLVAKILGHLATQREETSAKLLGKSLRKMLEEHGLSQRGAARELEISERTMRRYIAGDLPLPRTVSFALAWLIVTKTEESGS